MKPITFESKKFTLERKPTFEIVKVDADAHCPALVGRLKLALRDSEGEPAYASFTLSILLNHNSFCWHEYSLPGCGMFEYARRLRYFEKYLCGLAASFQENCARNFINLKSALEAMQDIAVVSGDASTINRARVLCNRITLDKAKKMVAEAVDVVE